MDTVDMADFHSHAHSNSPTGYATFGSGCFWCTEAVFTRIRGVNSVMPGYAGGDAPNPTYDAVATGSTGHAEVLRIEFDPSAVSYEQLVEVFFGTHDPTTLNRQGNDVGAQYRSVIFYHDTAQQRIAESVKARLEADRTFNGPIVTQIVPLKNFYPAEAEHRDYYANNPDQAYCRAVIDPKIAKFRARFASLLR